MVDDIVTPLGLKMYFGDGSLEDLHNFAQGYE